jgi:ABC-type branched-subunit amino acid transport system permease subunit
MGSRRHSFEAEDQMSVRGYGRPGWHTGWGHRATPYLRTAGTALPFIVLFAIPFYLNGYAVAVLPQFMLEAVMAMSLAMMWGQLGLLSFAQATFFMEGAYASGIFLEHASRSYSSYLAVLIAAAGGAVSAFLIGAFFFSGKVRDAYFVIASLAVPVLGSEIANDLTSVTGGFGGFTAPPMVFRVPGIGSFSMTSLVAGYFIALLVSFLCFVVLQTLKGIRFGRILVAIREDEDRTSALGYRTAVYKILAFTVSGGVAGVAGALYLPTAGNIGPSLGSVTNATLVVIWVAVSGRRSYIRTFVGSVIFAWISNYLNGLIPEYWSLVLALALIVIVLAEHSNLRVKLRLPGVKSFSGENVRPDAEGPEAATPGGGGSVLVHEEQP